MAPTVLKAGDHKVRKPLNLFGHVRWENCAAGVSGGVVSTLVLHPLDLIKVRFQVHEGSTVATKRPQYHGVVDAFSKIRQHEGVRGLYQGVTPNVWGSGTSWGLYFLFYSSIKDYMQGGDDSMVLSATNHTIAAAEAGVLTLILTNPIWVAKTRMCLQYDIALESGSKGIVPALQYKGMADCLMKTFKSEGFNGLYKGFVPGLFGVSHGAIQFMAYEELKKLYNKHNNRPANSKFATVEYLVFAAVSKMIASSVTYPYQVVRARLQDQHRNYNGAWEVVAKTWRFEGLRGLFKGITPYLLHVTPNICIVFLIYEKVRELRMLHRPVPLGSTYEVSETSTSFPNEAVKADLDNKIEKDLHS